MVKASGGGSLLLPRRRRCLLLQLLLLLSFFFFPGITSSFRSEWDDSSISVFETVSELVQKISAARDWDLNHIQILNIDSENVKYTKATVYELDIQIGERVLPAKFIDEVTDWQHIIVFEPEANNEKGTKKDTWDFKALQSVLTPFRLNGPLDLAFESSASLGDSSQEKDDTGDFKRVNVAAGSSVKVSGAQEVSLAQPIELSFPINRSSPVRSLAASILLLAAHTESHGFQQEDDANRLSLHITGPTLVASITGFDLPSRETGEEADLTEHVESASIWPFPLLNSSDPRLWVLEEMLKAYMGSSHYKKSFTIQHAKVSAATFVLFEFEIERELDPQEFKPEYWPEWKTRPSLRRYSFQVLAKVQNKALVPISVQHVKRYKSVETYSWSEVTSNISYTSFPTYLGVSSPMTLDVY